MLPIRITLAGCSTMSVTDLVDASSTSGCGGLSTAMA
jgi:hypothetical protein